MSAPTMTFGDMIEINRGKYQHWALYIGNELGKEMVIHLVLPEKTSTTSCFKLCSSSGSLYSNATITIDTLNNVAGQNSYKINNYLTLPTRKDDVIREHVDKMRGRTIKYDLFGNNCEHFVTFLRYGKSKSQQVDDFMKGFTEDCSLFVVVAAVSTAAAASILSK